MTKACSPVVIFFFNYHVVNCNYGHGTESLENLYFPETFFSFFFTPLYIHDEKRWWKAMQYMFQLFKWLHFPTKPKGYSHTYRINFLGKWMGLEYFLK